MLSCSARLWVLMSLQVKQGRFVQCRGIKYIRNIKAASSHAVDFENKTKKNYTKWRWLSLYKLVLWKKYIGKKVLGIVP